MRKIIYLLLLTTLISSCESTRDKCIKDLTENQGYSYDDACDACDEMASDDYRE